VNNKILKLLIPLISLPIIVLAALTIQQITSKASYKPANIIVDINNLTVPILESFSCFAQGGEEPPPMLVNTIDKMKNLNPKYVRLDHIYDSYDIVKFENNEYKFDFKKLDETVDHIIQMGAKPFFSLTYMPRIFNQNNSLIDPPDNWQNWKNLVQNTIEHYSGIENKNISGIYYEVWNEPELVQFGKWNIDGGKDYRILYYHSALASKDAKNTQIYYFGGPAVGSFYPKWIDHFLSYASQNKLRVDFYSYHRYHKNPEIFMQDITKIRNIINQHQSFKNLPIVISEWGIESDNLDINNSNAAAAFSINTISKISDYINLACNFEIKDGPPPSGGKWGLYTHENSENPLSPKPKQKAFYALSKLKGKRAYLIGDNQYISAIASYDSQKTVIIISNYDLTNTHYENFPITITGLTPSTYNLSYEYPLDGRKETTELVSTNGNISKNFSLSPNTILIIEIQPSASIASFVSGNSLYDSDKAIILNNSLGLNFTSPLFRLKSTGEVSFDIKPFWDNNDPNSFTIFDVPYSTTSGILNRLFLVKQKRANNNMLIFGVGRNEIEEISVMLPINNWDKNNWYKIVTSWDVYGLQLSVDSDKTIKNQTVLDIRNGNFINFYPINAAMDNLKITVGGDQIIERNFNGVNSL
jgi:hypothetical protein